MRKNKMNERYKELAQKAYEDVIKNTPSFLVTKELYEQKFAELIVQECIEVVGDCSDQFATRSQITEEIKQHFGVEL
jgi:DNA-binding transcriptional regulator YhcF (GntR family)